MNVCPKCNRKYADETLVFCLDDGARLVVADLAEEPPTVVSKTAETFGSARTIADTFPNQSFFTDAAGNRVLENVSSQPPAPAAENKPQAQGAKFDSSNDVSNKVLTIAPVVLALAHNYWQWLYMTGYGAFTFPGFLLSVNFYVWLLLLVGGAVATAFGLRNARDKRFAVIALVVLAINFLLCIIPRRGF